jgi:hypothetical protein
VQWALAECSLPAARLGLVVAAGEAAPPGDGVGGWIAAAAGLPADERSRSHSRSRAPGLHLDPPRGLGTGVAVVQRHALTIWMLA